MPQLIFFLRWTSFHPQQTLCVPVCGLTQHGSRYVLDIDVHFWKSLVLLGFCLDPVCFPVSVEAPYPPAKHPLFTRPPLSFPGPFCFPLRLSVCPHPRKPWARVCILLGWIILLSSLAERAILLALSLNCWWRVSCFSGSPNLCVRNQSLTRCVSLSLSKGGTVQACPSAQRPQTSSSRYQSVEVVRNSLFVCVIRFACF